MKTCILLRVDKEKLTPTKDILEYYEGVVEEAIIIDGTTSIAAWLTVDNKSRLESFIRDELNTRDGIQRVEAFVL